MNYRGTEIRWRTGGLNCHILSVATTIVDTACLTGYILLCIPRGDCVIIFHYTDSSERCGNGRGDQGLSIWEPHIER